MNPAKCYIHLMFSSGEAVALLMKRKKKVPCFMIDLPPSQHYPKKCISSPFRNVSSALILSFKFDFFINIIHISFCCPYNRPTPLHTVVFNLFKLCTHTYTLVIFIDFWSLWCNENPSELYFLFINKRKSMNVFCFQIVIQKKGWEDSERSVQRITGCFN